MMVRILYFAGLREAVGRSAEELALAPKMATVADLRTHLLRRGGEWEALAQGRSLRVAVNQRMAEPHTAIRDGDEIAFFPPVTGG
jgi:molybdopterin synthase sulfur carrier subunit